jgi:transcriptional regulator with XRE-family HTH domain
MVGILVPKGGGLSRPGPHAAMAETHEEARERFAANVERLRRGKGITAAELAERSLIDPGELKEILRGEREAGYATIALLAGALEVDPGELFRGIAWIPPEEGGEGRFEIEEADRE